jgi:hypothetical protein
LRGELDVDGEQSKLIIKRFRPLMQARALTAQRLLIRPSRATGGPEALKDFFLKWVIPRPDLAWIASGSQLEKALRHGSQAWKALRRGHYQRFGEEAALSVAGQVGWIGHGANAVFECLPIPVTKLARSTKLRDPVLIQRIAQKKSKAMWRWIGKKHKPDYLARKPNYLVTVGSTPLIVGVEKIPKSGFWSRFGTAFRSPFRSRLRFEIAGHIVPRVAVKFDSTASPRSKLLRQKIRERLVKGPGARPRSTIVFPPITQPRLSQRATTEIMKKGAYLPGFWGDVVARSRPGSTAKFPSIRQPSLSQETLREIMKKGAYMPGTWGDVVARSRPGSNPLTKIGRALTNPNRARPLTAIRTPRSVLR